MLVNHLTIDKAHRALARGIDFACLVAAFATATAIASSLSRRNMFIWPGPSLSDILGWPPQYVVFLLVSVIAWSIVSGYSGIYRVDHYDSSTGEGGRLTRACLLWMAAIGVATFLFKVRDVSRLFALSYVSLATILVALRDYAEHVTTRRTHSAQGRHCVGIVIGAGRQADWLQKFLTVNFCPQPYAAIRQVDSVDAGALDDAEIQFQGQMPESIEVFLAASDVRGDMTRLIPQLLKRGVRTHIVPALFDAGIFRLALGEVGGVPMITVRTGALTGLELAIKRAFDCIISTSLLALASPLIIGIALIIKLSSPGPVFFRQERLGKDGKRIHIVKFRTMHRDAEHKLKSNATLYQEYVKNNFKLPKGTDPRITPVGHILRELSLDEIPQLINVLRGDMSLVGPRPVVPAEIEKYDDYASLLLSVQPGLTGQWQVSGRSDIADYARRVRLDMEYIRDQSIGRDLQILIRTVPAVLSREGAH
jgi:exopolysaccharide biosynthesis polyprenyl glycosylphosphotransferase